jgi:hypothetical protein
VIDLSKIEVELTVDLGYGQYTLAQISSGTAPMDIDYSGEKVLRVNGEPYAYGELMEDGFRITRLIDAAKTEAQLRDGA